MANEYGADELEYASVMQPGHSATKLKANEIGQGVYDVYGKSSVFGQRRDDKPRVGPFPYRGGTERE